MAGTNPKRAPGDRPALSFLLEGATSWFIGTLVLFAVLIGGWSLWRWYRPEHLLNPINRLALLQLYESRTGGGSIVAQWHVSMVPSVFTSGQPRAHVVRRLEEAGYSVWEDNGNDVGYILRGGGTTALFVCTTDFHVHLKFDDEDALVAADSTGSGVCL